MYTGGTVVENLSRTEVASNFKDAPGAKLWRGARDQRPSGNIGAPEIPRW